MSNIQEQTIIAQVLEGDSEPYRLLVERYHRGLIQHLYNLTRDGDLAEDLAQEAFIKAYEKLAQYNGAYAFSTWLYKIADNIAFRQLKRARPTQDLDAIEEYLPDDSPSADELADGALARQAVQRALAKLSAEYRQVVSLYYWDNFSYEEIAMILNRPIGTIRTWLHRAKEQLREELYEQI